jgi:ankyrin repeat protein
VRLAQRVGAAVVAALLLASACSDGRDRATGGGVDDRLLRAAALGTAEQVVEALDQGAALEARDARRRTALLLAAAEDHVDVAKILVERGADVNAVDDQQDTPFLVTGVTGSVEMLDVLLAGRPDTRRTNRFGGVALIPAAERGHAPYVAAVLEKTDIDVDHVNDLGWTALLEAVLLGRGGPLHQQVIRTLLAHGADRSIADRDGVTALQHAEARGQAEVAALLRT